MPTNPVTLGSGAADAPGMDPRKTDTGKVAETTDSFDDNLNDRQGEPTRTYSAYDVKELHEKLSDFDNGELKRIPILAHGEKLQQGGKYIDLSDEEHTVFTAQGGREAQDPHLYVPKSETDYELWNRLTGVDVAADPTPADDLVPAQ